MCVGVGNAPASATRLPPWIGEKCPKRAQTGARQESVTEDEDEARQREWARSVADLRAVSNALSSKPRNVCDVFVSEFASDNAKNGLNNRSGSRRLE